MTTVYDDIEGKLPNKTHLYLKNGSLPNKPDDPLEEDLKAQRHKAFRVMKTHLLKQGAKSVNEHRECAYRGEGGMKCAVGALIKDSEYKPWLEGSVPSSPDVKIALENSGWPVDDVSLEIYTIVQRTHDKLPAEVEREYLNDSIYDAERRLHSFRLFG